MSEFMAHYSSESAFGSFAEIRHHLANDKLPFVIQHIKDLLEVKNKIVVFAYHRDTLFALHTMFREQHPALIMGGIDAKKKDEEVQRFQTDPNCKIFFGQITAAGTAITLTASDIAVFAEISWVPGEIFQATDRIHRIGQDRGVQIQFFVAQDTLEEFMLRSVIEKKTTIEQLVKTEDDIFA